MSRSQAVIYRMALRAYPRAFRHDYGPALLQNLQDRCRFGGEAGWRALARELTDVARTAPRMRGDSPMFRFGAAAVAVILSAFVALAVSPIAVVAVGVATAATLFGSRSREQETGDVAHRPSLPWAVAAAAALAGAIAIPATDGGELSEPLWLAMAMLALVSAGLAAMAVSRRFGPVRPRS